MDGRWQVVVALLGALGAAVRAVTPLLAWLVRRWERKVRLQAAVDLVEAGARPKDAEHLVDAMMPESPDSDTPKSDVSKSG